MAERLPEMLRAGGPARELASQELHDLLVRAALAYLLRQGYPAAAFGADDFESLAEDFAQESLAIILRQLESFRAQSRFTTWAYRIVINLVADEHRRRAWRRQSFDETTGGNGGPWTLAQGPEQDAEGREVRNLVKQVIQRDLTPRQRHALVGRYFEEKPLIVLADELGTNKDNVYKLIHDARKHLKRSLLAVGLTQADVFTAFARR
jgi:RNA polymerase sigma-70 factor, ECF subfamily